MAEMTLSKELSWRGFLNQTTLNKLTKLDEKKLIFYHGYDASADSQTVGNLAAMMMDRCFLRHGHKAILLAGGATSLIGDPGGKGAERELQSEARIAHNVSRAQEQLRKVFSEFDVIFVNNLDWTKNMRVIEFLRTYGKNFSVTALTQRDYIAKRLGKDGAGISYAEFSYTILQGVDYLYLFDKYGCTLQIGGADQWGNCLSGVELIRRIRGKSVDAITLPLVINKTTGKKFGKTEEGTIWLDPDKTKPTDFYQFWINVEDENVEAYLKIFTELEKEELDKLIQEFNKNKPGRIAQRRLAYETTKFVHGQNEAIKAQKNAEGLKSGITKTKNSIYVNSGISLVDALYKAELVNSKSEARQVIADKGVYINDKTYMNEALNDSDFINGKLQLRRGKKLQNTRTLELKK